MQLDMMQAQAELEAEMASLGVEKFRAASQEAREGERASDVGSGATALSTLVGPVTASLTAFLTADLGKGRQPHAAKLLSALEPEVAAFIAVKVLLNKIVKTQRMMTIAGAIGSAVELEARVSKFARENPAYAHTMDRDLAGKSTNARHRAGVFGRVLALHEDGWEAWGDRNRALVGLKLIETIATSTGMLEKADVRRGRKIDATIQTTPRFRDWLASLDTRLELLAPEFMPCVVEPKDWVDQHTGGYHTDAFAFPPKLVKTRNRRQRRALEKADLSTTLKAVNAIQRTPWRVEKRVLAVAQALVEMGSELAGLPSLYDAPLPTRPVDIDTNEAALAGWKKEAAAVYGANRSSMGRRLLALKTLHLADKFAPYPAIWFPHQLDFRGRVYSIPQVLSPQGGDLAKGLLVFAEGAALDTEDAVEWFLVHGANSYGVDKVSMKERVNWVWAHGERVLSCADNPLDDLWWTEADSPFVFLAWAFEFAEHVRNPADFRSHLPPAMDGSCNGLQHYSAMLRDPVAGRAVNLVPGDKPQDIYAEVAKVAMERLASAVEIDNTGDYVVAAFGRGDEVRYAHGWLAFGIDRKITKRSVMVLPYGGTLNSCVKYTRYAVMEKIAAGAPNPFGDDLMKACGYLAGVIWGSIGEVVVSARLAMGFLQECSRVVSAEGLPLEWTTPSGFPVVQAYPQETRKQIDTRLFGQRFQPEVFEAVEDSIDPRRQSNGIAPNFVHSLDASALVLTVNAAVDAGITRFAMIHDSYGTSAADTALLASILREQFVAMYEAHNPLEEFRESFPEEIKNNLPGAPMVGGLDLSAVKHSRYFFA